MAMRLSREPRTFNPPHTSNAKVISAISAEFQIPRERAFELLREAHSNSPLEMSLLTESQAREEIGSSGRLPVIPFDAIPLERKSKTGDRPGPPPSLVRLAGEPALFVLMTMRGGPAPGGRGPGGPPGGPNPFIFNTIILAISVLAGSSISLFLLFNSMRTEAKEAGAIIEELKRGNLKARMPVKKMDEVGKLMLEFNRMADEIDRLVQGIKDSEQSRMALLQELAHDLRTPVASLKNLLETMSFRAGEISSETREELLSLSVREVEYFERLVEDLLLLAQVTEPKYRVERKQVDLDELIEEELELVTTRYISQGQSKTVLKSLPHEGVNLLGDTHLLRRLVRNALENAFSFAESEVTLKLISTPTQILITIQDDGPGLSDEGLAAFGYKRITRFMSGEQDGRLSVGLGSVIMRAITSAHAGTLSIKNRLDAQGTKRGAEVEIILAIS